MSFFIQNGPQIFYSAKLISRSFATFGLTIFTSGAKHIFYILNPCVLDQIARMILQSSYLELTDRSQLYYKLSATLRKQLADVLGLTVDIESFTMSTA